MSADWKLVAEAAPAAEPTLLTIVIGAYQHEAYVAECIASVLACTQRERIELIVIDDGSRDTTLEVARRALDGAAIDHRLYTKPNRGLTDSLDAGLALARSPWFALIASDDAYLPEGLDALLDALSVPAHVDAQSPASALLCQAEYMGDQSGPVYGRGTAELFALPAAQRLEALCLEYPKPMLLQSAVFATEALRRVAPWADHLLLDDWPTFVRIAQAEARGEGRFAFRPEITLCRYRVHHGGIHRRLDRQLRACLEVTERVVPDGLRARAKSQVLGDIALIHLYERRPLEFLKLWGRALLAWPRPGTVGRLAGRLGRAAWRRLGRLS